MAMSESESNAVDSGAETAKQVDSIPKVSPELPKSADRAENSDLVDKSDPLPKQNTFTSHVFEQKRTDNVSWEGFETFVPEAYRPELHLGDLEARCEELETLLKTRRLVIVSGGQSVERMRLAARFAPKVRGGRPMLLAKGPFGVMFEQIFRKIGYQSSKPGEPPGFFVWATSPESVNGVLDNLAKALGDAWDSKRIDFHCLILVDFARHFPARRPENLQFLSLEPPKRASSRSFSEKPSFREIFAPSGLTETITFNDAVRDVILRPMIRIAVMFGPVSEGRFSKLVSAYLKGKTLNYTSGSGKTATQVERDAEVLWVESSQTLLDLCGLQEDASQGRKIRFISDEYLAEAEQAAWRGSSMIVRLFEQLEKGGVANVFVDVSAGQGGVELDSTIVALGALGRESPESFIETLVPIVFKQYAAWLEKVTDVPSNAAEHVPSFIHWIARSLPSRPEGRRWRNHFCQRVTLICTSLLSHEDSRPVVADVLRMLCASGGHELAWIICWNLRTSDFFKLSVHGKACVGNAPRSTLLRIARDLAGESAASPALAIANLKMVRGWDDGKDGSNFRKLFMLYIVLWIHEAAELRCDSDLTQTEAVERHSTISPTDQPVVLDGMKAALLDGNFNEVLDVMPFGSELADTDVMPDQNALAIALTLVALCIREPVEPRAFSFQIADQVLESMELPRIKLVAAIVDGFFRSLKETRKSLGYSEDDDKRRQFIDEMIDSLYTLKSL